MLQRNWSNTIWDIRVLDYTSKEDDWQRREDQVVQQDECVLVQVGCIETNGTGLAFSIKDVD